MMEIIIGESHLTLLKVLVVFKSKIDLTHVRLIVSKRVLRMLLPGPTISVLIPVAKIIVEARLEDWLGTYDKPSTKRGPIHEAWVLPVDTALGRFQGGLADAAHLRGVALSTLCGWARG
uniref:Uncharacterized protein n=1 Tax=Solanum tuberosum TaxID=4113 RepID=M1DM77_SOLTU